MSAPLQPEQPGPWTGVGLNLLAAALALPVAQVARAETPPEQGLIAFKYLSYTDRQPGQDRIAVRSPAVSVMSPIGSDWSIAADAIVDSISGASPAYHTAGFTKLRDERRAADVAVTRYAANGSVTVGINYSNESDYRSSGASIRATRSNEDKNTTWNAGLNLSYDTINPTNRVVVGERKTTRDLTLGVTQVLTQRDIAQLILGYARGAGYFSDPYKAYDERPRQRNHTTALLRWNHHFERTEGTGRFSYRYYDDSFGIKAHTITAEYVQPLARGWTLTPLLRLYSQSAASFYIDVDPAAAPFATNPPADATLYTEDQRLSAFGAHTLGLKLEKQIGDNWKVDLKAERYEQRGSWSFSGTGSPNLAPFMATSYQLGLSRRF